MDDSDRQVFLEIVGNVVEKHNWLYHAFRLMDNHYHVLIEPKKWNWIFGSSDFVADIRSRLSEAKEMGEVV